MAVRRGAAARRWPSNVLIVDGRAQVHSPHPTKHILLLLESSYYLEPLSPFLFFPIEGFLEFYTKESRNFSGVTLETDKLMSCHLDGATDSIRHWALWCAASVARTGMYANQRSDDVHF
jgi:hypothetical protein